MVESYQVVFKYMKKNHTVFTRKKLNYLLNIRIDGHFIDEVY